MLLIGDRAMRACLPGFRFAYDLGQEWTTGRACRSSTPSGRCGAAWNSATTESAFHKAKEHGLANAGAIAQREAAALGLDAGFCRRYLEHHHPLRPWPRELAGLQQYRGLVDELESPVLATGAA